MDPVAQHRRLEGARSVRAGARAAQLTAQRVRAGAAWRPGLATGVTVNSVGHRLVKPRVIVPARERGVDFPKERRNVILRARAHTRRSRDPHMPRACARAQMEHTRAQGMHTRAESITFAAGDVSRSVTSIDAKSIAASATHRRRAEPAARAYARSSSS